MEVRKGGGGGGGQGGHVLLPEHLQGCECEGQWGMALPVGSVLSRHRRAAAR